MILAHILIISTITIKLLGKESEKIFKNVKTFL